MHICTQAINAWSQVEGFEVPTKPENYSQLYELSPLAACVMQFILLAYMVRCDRVEQRTVLQNQESQKTSWGGYYQSSAQIPLDLFRGSVCTNPTPSNACNWGSSLEICLQATGAASCISHVDLEVSCEWALGKDWWGERMYDGNMKGQSLHFKPSNETTLAAGETH